MEFTYLLIILVILAFLLLFIIQFKTNNVEGYNWGTIDQLNAKDQQDTYLTGNSPYPNYPWMIPYDPLRPKKSQYNLYTGFYPSYRGYNGVMYYQ